MIGARTDRRLTGEADASNRRTHGGTRIIWVFDQAFDGKGLAMKNEDRDRLGWSRGPYGRDSRRRSRARVRPETPVSNRCRARFMWC